jgi:hypothetical protein
MKAVSKSKKSKKDAAKSYVDAQLRIMRKYGVVKLSDSKYKSIVRNVERTLETV